MRVEKLGGEFAKEGAEAIVPFFPKITKVNNIEKNEGDSNNGIVSRTIFIDIF